MYLIDTNVISETIRIKSDQNVVNWFKKTDVFNAYISVITIGEIRKGIEKLDLGNKKQQLTQWLEIDLMKEFEDRIISINCEIAEKWGFISSKANLPAMDALIAASAIVHNFKLVTRNTKDFDQIAGLEIVNPWLV